MLHLMIPRACQPEATNERIWAWVSLVGKAPHHMRTTSMRLIRWETEQTDFGQKVCNFCGMWSHLFDMWSKKSAPPKVCIQSEWSDEWLHSSLHGSLLCEIQIRFFPEGDLVL